ncbi:cytochrome P450 [Amorphus sp. 3PC139-8]|uniref:cytochrome P450 n=1 Tax=Amorphus sp. 3PC139-8 TaxID=2735676 RepID=UPI00345DDF46
MTAIPHTSEFDLTASVLREGYLALPRRRQELGSDVFRSRLLLYPVIVMAGEKAARVFYEPGAFSRQGAMPQSVVKLLQDHGSVQTLDDAAHRVRKQMFLRMMTPTALEDLAICFSRRWAERSIQWEARERIVLFDEVRPILCATACDWSGIPSERYALEPLSDELSAMIEYVGTLGWQHWQARRGRRRAERWAADLVADVRVGEVDPPAESALSIIAHHQDADGRSLTSEVAAVELLNVLRPIVAVARYVVFAAHALHVSGSGTNINSSDSVLEAFAHEVRRAYPFFPAIGGRARHDVDWNDNRIVAGSWVLFDLHGTNHDPAIWPDPDVFRLERFLDWDDDPYRLVPQGGGYVETNHRCPGERVTMVLIKTAVRELVATDYTVPHQDLSIDLGEMPALPKSGFVVTGVRRRKAVTDA